MNKTANLLVSLDFYQDLFHLPDGYTMVKETIYYADDIVNLLIEGPFPESIEDGSTVYVRLYNIDEKTCSWNWRTIDGALHGDPILIPRKKSCTL